MNEQEARRIFDTLAILQKTRFAGLERVLNDDVMIRKVTASEAEKIVGTPTRCGDDGGHGVVISHVHLHSTRDEKLFWITAMTMKGLEMLKRIAGSDIDIYTDVHRKLMTLVFIGNSTGTDRDDVPELKQHVDREMGSRKSP